MLKLWVPATNLTSDNSVGKLLIRSLQIGSTQDTRIIFIVYLIVLTTYLLLDLTKRSALASPNLVPSDTKGMEQPKQSFWQPQAIATNARCALPLLPAQPAHPGAAQKSTNLLKSCYLERQNRPLADTIALKEAIDWVKYIELFDLKRLNSDTPTAPVPNSQNSSNADQIALTDSIDWVKYIEIFDLKQLNLLQPGDLFTLPLFPRTFPPVPTDRPFVAPSAPLVPALPQPNSTPIQNPKLQPSPATVTDPRYLIAPRQIDLGQFNPALTQIVVNDVPINHRSQTEVTGGIETGDRRTTDVGLNATTAFGVQAQESVSNKRVYRLDYRSNYSQIRTLRQQRAIKTTTIIPETLFGMRQQISFTGDCFAGMNGGSSVSATGEKLICSYLPGLKTDESTINQQTLLPTRIPSTSNFGDIATPASLLAMKEPGFQGGADGQLMGLDFYFPRIGAQPGNTQSQTSSFDRFESNTTVPMVSIGRVHQVILANGTNTAISRTVRGFNYILNDANSGWNAAISAATELLPDLETSLPNGKKGGSTAVDRNLILATNNNRTPENSFTAYYSGIGTGKTPKENGFTSANYHGIWIGFSPVIERQVAIVSPVYQLLGPERVVLAAGGEGGPESNSEVIAAVNQTDFDSSTITNAYVQTYLTTYEREVNTISSTTIRERTNYFPHLSATGNITTADSVLRYYTGFIFNPNNTSVASAHKAYAGVDFTKVDGKLSYNLGAIGYLNPDSEYYSKLTGTISQQLSLGKNPAYNMSLFAGFNYAIDGTKIFDEVSFKSANSYVNVGARANLGSVSVGTNYYIATGLTNSIGDLISTNASWRISDGLVLAGYYTPVNNNVARSPFGASASIRLGSNSYSPTLSLSWNRNETDLGINADNTRGGVRDNVFSIYLRFDSPPNSFK
ncbi:hypothetical protein [Chamaesiphon polymorphus]|uniref:Uncharacterized protein n=1 Tax=Chamaesiphon polymorphus CCALA 037 TaxID=2107692 RepID=A0A2T1GF95_9CYAN|nr:hypothetical protein [Chamaesiphon polymorphus]PSB56261.1 hypothetical protein C7B77_12470 [Chamaesiphon polymorphus CCALA 037]